MDWGRLSQLDTPNAHCSDELFKFAGRSGRRFLYFQERPKNHWYDGGGIGVAF